MLKFARLGYTAKSQVAFIFKFGEFHLSSISLPFPFLFLFLFPFLRDPELDSDSKVGESGSRLEIEI